MKRFKRTGVWLAAGALALTACGGEEPAEDAVTETETPEEPAVDAEAEEEPAEEEPAEEEPVDEEAEAAAPELEVVDGQLQPLESGWPSDPITLMVEDDPGSGDSIYASQLQEAMTDLSPVQVNLEHRGDFGNLGTFEAISFMNNDAAGSDGRIALVVTIPGFVADALVIDTQEEINLGIADVNGLAVTEQVPYVVHQNVDAPWGQGFQEMIDYCHENPGEIRYISGGPGSGQDVIFNYYMNQQDCEVNTIIGGGQEERALAVASGEGDVTVSPQNLVLPFFQDGRVVVTLVAGDVPAEEPWPEAPNSSEFGMAENDPGIQSRGFVVATNTPEDQRQWLQELVRLASEDPGFQEVREEVPGLYPEFIPGEEMNELMQTAYDTMLPVVQEQGIYFGDQ